jgi:hypothetical protein
MKIMELISYIETTASNILQKEYNTTDAYIVIENINFSFLDDAEVFYTAIIRYGVKDKSMSFEVTSPAGLANNFFEFTETEAFAFAIFITNLVIKVVDSNIDLEEDLEALVEAARKKDYSGIC